MKKILLFLLFQLLFVPVWSQRHMRMHAGIGLVGYSTFGDGLAFTSDVHIPIFKSVYLAPAFSQISFKFFKNGFVFHERDMQAGDLKKSYSHTSGIREQTTSWRVFLYVNPFEWFPHRPENMDLEIGAGYGHFQILRYSYRQNGVDVENELTYIRAENNLSVRLVFDYYLSRGYMVGLTLGYEPSYGEYYNFNPFFTVNLGIPLFIKTKE